MKAFLVNDIIELPVSDMYMINKYPTKVGLYIADDGVMYQLVSHDGVMVSFLGSLPRESMIKEYERIVERDIDLLQKQLSELNKNIQDLRNDLDEGLNEHFDEINTKLNRSTSEMSLSGLTKLIAVAQKPELLDKKV